MNNLRDLFGTQRAPQTTAYIEVTLRNGATTRHKLEKIETSIGRDGSKNDICVNENVVSAQHLLIRHDNSSDSYTLVHPHPARLPGGTTNGLIFERRRVPGKEEFKHDLGHGDSFSINNEVVFRFIVEQPAAQGPRPQATAFDLNKDEMTIGRTSANDIQLDHPQVSARHAVLRKSGSGHLLIDRNSTNHTYVNGRSITRTLLKRGDEIHIGPFQYIYQGGLLQPITSNQVIDIKAFQLKRTVMKDGKHVPLLNDISLAIPACSFVALVGASGAGKSTLMDALNGVRPVDGKVYYDGKDYYASFEAFRAQIGYVPQDDIVHRELTVERALSYAARLRLPDDFSSMQIRQRVNEVLHDVEMYEHRSKLITKLSGGQRKRVSIALELLAKPSVFFLDEPTSGLDPGLDRKLMKLLRNLARKGQTIVLVTHATANIMECDYVCFLSEGSMVYFGPPEKATRFFKVKDEDFTDIYIQLEEAKRNKRTPEQVNKFRTSSDYREYVEKLLGRNTVVAMPQPGQQKTKTRPRGNPWRQFGLLSLRYLELLIKDWKNLLILALQAPIIALILFVLIKYGIGTGGFDPANVVQCPTTAQVMTTSQNVLYPAISDPTHPIVSKSCSVVQHYLATAPTGQKYVQGRGDNTKALQDFIVPGPGDATTILFIMAFAAIMFGCINAAREIVKELSIYRRERMVCIGISPYIFSKMLVMGLLCLFQCAVLVFAVNLVDPFHKGILLPGALEVYITLSLTSLAGLMMGLALSAFVSNNDRAMSFVPILLIPQVIFSGTLFPLKEGFLQWLGALFPVRWAMAALGSSVGLHSDKLGGDTLFGTIETYHGTLFSTYTQREATTFLLLMWLALVAIIVIFGIITTLLMKWKDRRR